MKQPHKHAEVLRAIADGKEVQFCLADEWYSATEETNPITHSFLSWRIKPEPKPDVVGFCRVDRFSIAQDDEHNLRLTFDGETGKLKKSEVIE